MNPTTNRGVFIEAAALALIAEATRWVAGAYDHLSGGKIVGVSLIALLTALVAGYRALRTLHTEPTSPAPPSVPSSSPKAPNE